MAAFASRPVKKVLESVRFHRVAPRAMRRMVSSIRMPVTARALPPQRVGACVDECRGRGQQTHLTGLESCREARKPNALLGPGRSTRVDPALFAGVQGCHCSNLHSIDDCGHDPSKQARKHPSERLERLGIRKGRGAPACELQQHPVRLGGTPETPGPAPELVHCRAVARGSAGSFPVGQLWGEVRGGSCSGGCPGTHIRGTHIRVARHGAFRQGHGLRGRIRRAQAPYRWDASRRIAPRAKLDAVFFHLYGITDRNDVEYVYSAFSAVKSQEIQAFGSFRSRDLCLSYMNALAAGQPDASIQ